MFVWPSVPVPIRPNLLEVFCLFREITFWLREHLVRKRGTNAVRIVVGGFGAIILLGALLLTLPIASRSGESAGFLTGLFTSTSATCVTGLVMADTWTQWSFFGQLVLLCLIQIGGLGFMSVLSLVSFALHRRISLSERLIMVSSLNLNDMDGVVRVVRHALYGTFIIEGAAAVVLSLRFIPIFGFAGGLWRGIFHAISGFCNAGFDLMGGYSGQYSSLMRFDNDPVVLFTIMALVVVGGLGFFVWEDLWAKRCWRKLSLYSKLVLTMTGALIVGGTLFYLLVEFHNPATLGPMPLGKKLLNALFQSVTLRTAGFNTIDQGALLDSSLAMGCILMLIGGSSGSTAGGMKTVTAWTLIMSLVAGLKGREAVTFRGRSVPYRRVLNALTLGTMFVVMFVFSAMALSLADGVPFLAAAFETASAMGTVGVTTGITPELSSFSHVLLILLMYTGRVGMFSFTITVLTRGRGQAKLKYPEFNIMIG